MGFGRGAGPDTHLRADGACRGGLSGLRLHLALRTDLAGGP